MSTGIRFPADLRPPDREGYGDEMEEARTEFQPDVGAARRRNRYRTVPNLWDVAWTFTQAEYTLFDNWVQFTIDGGALEFDIQLLDDDATLTWYTVRAQGAFSYDIPSGEGELRYRVKWKLRALEGTFGTERDAGTDELRGRATVGVTTAGALLVYTPFRGSTAVGLTATAKILALPLYGLSTPGFFWLPRGELDVPPPPLYGLTTIGLTATAAPEVIIGYYPEFMRQWMNMSWMGPGLAMADLQDEPEAVQREWMES